MLKTKIDGLQRKCTHYEACMAEKARLEYFFAKLNARSKQQNEQKLEDRLIQQMQIKS